MPALVDAAVFLVLAVALLAAGVRVGMIVAPRLGAWVERHEEPPHDDE